MDESLSLKFLGIGTKAIQARNSGDEGLIHGILLQNADKELAVFVSIVGFKENNREKDETMGVIGGFSLEDLKKQLNKLKKENWIPVGLIQIDLGEKAVENFLKDGNKQLFLTNIYKIFKNSLSVFRMFHFWMELETVEWFFFMLNSLNFTCFALS